MSFPRDYLVPLPAPGFEDVVEGMADVSDVLAIERSLMEMLRAPVFARTAGEVVWHSSPKFGQIAGCMVTEGTVYRSKPIRVLRDNVVIYEGELESLRRFKDDASEVRNGMECGIGVKNYTDVKVGDQIEVFDRTRVERKLESTGA